MPCLSNLAHEADATGRGAALLDVNDTVSADQVGVALGILQLEGCLTVRNRLLDGGKDVFLALRKLDR